jgi:hypothetical protein
MQHLLRITAIRTIYHSEFKAMSKQKEPEKHYLKIYNGRIKVYCDGYVMFSFNQIDFSGYYAYKDDTNLYGLDIYMNRASAGHQIMEVYFKTKETWLAISRLLDENL